MKKILFILAISFIVSCSENAPTEKNDINLIKLDTLSREINEGIYLTVDSLKDTYSLDETISAKVTLRNLNSELGLNIYIPNWPPYLEWHILDQNKMMIDFYPKGHEFIEYKDTLKLGETLLEDVIWNVKESNNGLKAFSGEYIIEINFNGIDFNKTPHLIKHFKINEIGEGISTNLEFDYNSTDSVKLDLFCRNRISKEITIDNSNKVSQLFLIKNNYEKPDTVYKEDIRFNWQTKKLHDHSDILLYKYTNEKIKFNDVGIRGGYICEFHLLINGKKYIASNFIFL